jgi:hypothetical protein
MTATALKKLLDERKIEGRSKLTKKESMVKVLELFDQNPEDKSAIAALVAEISTPRKRNATKSEVEPEETTEDKKEEESKMNVEKPKKKSKAKKETSSESEEPVKEEKPKKKSKAKEASSESEEGDKEKPKRKGKSKKETSEDSKKNAKTKTNKKKEEETPVESTITSTSDVLLISDKEPSPSIIDMEHRVEDSEATQKIEDSEATQKIEETSVPKKRGRKLPGAVKVLPEIYVNEEKKEISDETETSMEATPTAHQPEMVDPEDDPAMIEVFKLTRDILRQMKYLAREAHRDDNFKKSWTKQLSNMKKDFEHQLGMLGATVDEE